MISSERTRVPPVTAERSPPLSRMTGADSPVMADSSTVAMPSTTSPSPGITSPAATTHRSPSCSCGGRPSRRASRRAGGRWPWSRPGSAQRGGLRLAPSFRHRFGEVGEQHGEPQPQRHQPGEDVLVGRRRAEVPEEQDGGQHGADLDHEHDRVADHGARVQLDEAVLDRLLGDGRVEQLAGRRRPAPRLDRTGRGRLEGLGEGGGHPALLEDEVLDDGAEREHGEEGQAGDDQDHAERRGRRTAGCRWGTCPTVTGTFCLRTSEPAMASDRDR